MALSTVEKQIYESFFIGGSIYNVQQSGEAIVLANSTVVAEDKDGTDVSSTLLSQATKSLGDDENGGTNNVLKIRLQGGTEAASPYKVTFKMETDQANKWEVDILVKVEEV
jgi:hypothetical protein